MKYKYRWWYAFFILLNIVGGGSIFLLQPIFAHIEALRETEKQLHKRIQEARPLSRQHALEVSREMAPPRPRSDLLSDLILHLQTNGLTVVSAHFLPGEPEENDEIATVKLVTQGDFLKLFLFLSALNQSPFPMVVEDFSYEAKAEDRSIFTAKIALFRHKIPHVFSKNNVKIPRNPFCFAMPFSHQSSKNESVKAKKFSLYTLKMMGYIEQENHSQALFLLPDLTLISLGLGDFLGKEEAKIMEIKPHYVSLLLPNQQRVLLKR